MAAYSPAQFIALVQMLAASVQSLQAQLEWFQRQTFGTKSERLRVLENAQQLALGEVLAPPAETLPAKEHPVAAHTRREPQKDTAVGEADSVPFFDEARVPVETIELPDPQVEGLSPDDYEVISQKVSYRLAQRPGSYVILKYLRSVIKRRDRQTLSCTPAPVGVIEGSRADVSFVAGLLVDKFAYHLPLYRQHQRLQDSGVQVSRPWLTQLSQQSITLLEPIYEAQFDSIRSDRVKAMDETPIKAGRKERGKMKIGYFWPVGEAKTLHRLTHSKSHVEAFFAWVDRRLEEHGLRPTTPFTKALNYVHERRLGLEVFLTDPEVPLDTNHLERALRAIPMGRKNWNFCWTELGAQHVGIVQSLIVTCRLHGIDVYTYLVDVLQRVGRHPASRVAELTPRQWKQRFAAAPLRSALHTLVA